MSRVRYGMIGGGPGSFIGEAHRRSINIDGQAELVAGVFSRSKEKSMETAKALGVDPARCYSDFETMAKEEAAREDGIEFVCIVTPNVTHYPAAKAFLEAGI
ncbi:MAG: Gfo/Idh/MocA family oxidoreductase, partial [Eubacterium sp.]|nr:Gfo/Idh/MocA family oxidoreductase [Eubacterium sp.]